MSTKLRPFVCALLVLLAGLVVACGARPVPNPNGPAADGGEKAPKDKGAGGDDGDLKVTRLDVDAKGLVPCLMWADSSAAAFYALDNSQATLLRFSGADYKTKQ